jgi:hypothetical protein
MFPFPQPSPSASPAAYWDVDHCCWRIAPQQPVAVPALASSPEELVGT